MPVRLPTLALMKRIVIALVALSSVAGAQGRPFSFTVPFPDGPAQTVLRYDGGWSNGAFEPFSADYVQHTSEVDAPIGSRVLLMASGGLALEGPTSQRYHDATGLGVVRREMAQAEVLVDVLRFSGWHLAVSGGARHDFDGSVLALSRVSLSRSSGNWLFAANVYAAKPIAGEVQNPKDIPWADVTASVGATRRITSGVSLGVETVAGDAESANKVIFLGPLASFTLPGRRARLTVSGGPIVQTSQYIAPTYTMIGKYSMPPHNGQTGYNLRLAVSIGL